MEINSILDRLAEEDVTALPAESMGEDQIALERINNRIQAESLRRLHRFESARVTRHPAPSARKHGCGGSAT